MPIYKLMAHQYDGVAGVGPVACFKYGFHRGVRVDFGSTR